MADSKDKDEKDLDENAPEQEEREDEETEETGSDEEEASDEGSDDDGSDEDGDESDEDGDESDEDDDESDEDDDESDEDGDESDEDDDESDEDDDEPRRARSASRPRSARGGANAGKGTRLGVESVGFLVIVSALLVLANVVGHYLFKRFDATHDRRYSLAQSSQRIVSELDETMRITAYFSGDLPPPHNTVESTVRYMLGEYQAASGGQIELQFVRVDDEEDKEAARDDGMTEIPFQGIRDGTFMQTNGFSGLRIEYLGDSKTIPLITGDCARFPTPRGIRCVDTDGLEYEITQRIRLLNNERLEVGVVSGHGGVSPTKGMGNVRSALEHYNFQEVDLSEGEISSDLRALLIVGATEEFSDPELRRINQYVMNGGSLGVFGGGLNINLEGMPAATPSPARAGLNQLLEPWGMELTDKLVIDMNCATLPMQTPIGLQVLVGYPPAPRVPFTDEQQEHSVLFRIPDQVFFFPSAVEVGEDFSGQVLARSGGRSGEDGDPLSWTIQNDNISLRPRDPREFIRLTTPESRDQHTIMAAVEGTLPSAFPEGAESSDDEEASSIEAPSESTEEVRVLVVGTSSLLRDEFFRSAEEAPLSLNAIDWLANDLDLIAIRAKTTRLPALDVPQAVQEAQEEAEEAVQDGQQALQEGNEEGVEQALEDRDAALRDAREAFDDWNRRKFIVQVAMTSGAPLFISLFGLIWWFVRRNRRSSLDQYRAELQRNKRRRR